jgi:hypothetical protein
MALSGETPTPVMFAAVGAEVPPNVALEQVPEELVSNIPELTRIAFARVGNKIVLVNPALHRVLAVLE